MATSFSFNTLQRRELFSFSLCKCFTTNPLHYSHSSSSFPPPKHALTPKLSSFFLVNSPLTTAIYPVNNNNAIFGSNSTETLDYRDNSENSSDGYLISERIVKEEFKKRVVDNGKSSKNGERINLGKRNDKNYGNYSLNDERVERKVKRNGVWVKNDGGDCSREFGYESNQRNGGRSNYGKWGGEGDKVLFSKSSGDRGRRSTGEMLGDVGVVNVENSGREFSFANNGRNGARSNHGNGNDKILLSKSSGDRGRRRIGEMLGNVGVGKVENSGREFSFANKGDEILLSKSSGDRGRRRMEKSLGHVGGQNVGNSRREFGSENIDDSGERIDFGKRNGKGGKSLSFKSSGDRATRRMENIVGSGDKRRGFDSEKGGQKGTWSTSIWVKDGKSGDVVGGKMHRQTIKDSSLIVKKESSSKIGSKVGKKEKPSKKSKVGSPEFELRVGLDMCSKKGDVMGAISLYDAGVKKGVKMGQYQYTVLLYLCSSAAMGVIRPAKSGSSSRSLYKVASHDSDDDFEQNDDDTDDVDDENMGVEDQTEKLEVNEIRVSEDVKKYALERGFEVYERMCMDKVEMNEAALTSVARMAMAMGNGDMAFDTVKQMKSMGISPKLRSYGPALSVFSSSGELDKAFAVEEHMSENNIHPEEPELEALLRVSVQAGKADRVYYVLHKLRTSVRSVSPSTADLIEKWFKSKESSRVGKRKWDQNTITEIMKNGGGGWHGQGWLGTGKWAVARTSVAADGLCQCCGEKLALIDLDPQETENFAESVASIAIKRDKNSSFHKFQRWLDYYGPFEAVVDAANVGLFSQRKFKAAKVNAVVNGIRQLLPSRNWPLIILHNKRVTGSMMEQPTNRAFVDRWKNADALYPTPTGSNDDWYWLYAAIKFKCLLVTNDEMRDHTFQLLGNDFFPKWKERHQVRFSFSEIGPVFHMPPPCSVVIQESDSGKWHIPIASDHQSEEERTWLCITRPKLLVKQQGP